VTSYITTGAGPPSTVLVTQTPVPSEDSLGQSATAGSKGGVSGGAIAGIVIGVIGGLAAIVAAVAFFCWRRRKQERSRESSFSASRIGGAGPSSTVPTSNSVPSRQVSQMSQAGLLGSKAPRINTTGLGGTYGSDARSPDGVNSAVDRRSVGTDQRLNPWAIYKADDQASSVSLHDERDYSRQLRVSHSCVQSTTRILTSTGRKSR
jgi:cell wall integrity and stress response component